MKPRLQLPFSCACCVALLGLTLAPAALPAAAQGLTVLPVVNAAVGDTPLPVTIVAGHRFFGRGAGFRPGETLKLSVTFPLYSGNLLVETKTATAGGDGASPGVLMSVPNDARAGILPLSVTGPGSGRKARARIRVVYHPSIRLASPTIHPGQTAGVTGTGFAAGAHVTVAVVVPKPGAETETLTQAVTGDQRGAFTASIAIPPGTAGGRYTVTAVDPTSNLQARAALTVAARPQISLQPNPVSPGRTVVISGREFPALAPVALTAAFLLSSGGNRKVTARVRADTRGSFTVRLPVPGNAAGGRVRVTAVGTNVQAASNLQVRQFEGRITVSPASVIPGQSVAVQGSGYPAGDAVDITMAISLTSGARTTLRTSSVADGLGKFSARLAVPANAAAGTVTVLAASHSTGGTPSAQVSIARLAASIVALPTTAVPGTQMTVHAFGFAAYQPVRISLNGRALGSATTDVNGAFTLKVTVPGDVASGSYTLTASAGNGQKASVSLAVQRHVTTHFYFPSEYTGRGYSNYLTFTNLTAIRARVTIIYQLKSGATQTKTATANPHTRYTENVNADLGSRVSAAAEVTADVPIAAEGVVYRGSDGAVVPGSSGPATAWYFANGNTTHGYREYVAVQNPNPGPVQIAVRFLPAHSKPFTVYRTMLPTSRTTVKVSSYVKDAVGINITSSGPVVANRTLFVHHGVTSKNGVAAPHRVWYFAAGPQESGAKHWIAVINPSDHGTYVSLQTYSAYGKSLGTAATYLQPYVRAGYLINAIAHHADAAVVVTGYAPVVAEQMTYVDSRHDASTDTFGAFAPGKSWSFTGVNTSTSTGQNDSLDLFNPNAVAVPIVVQFITASGRVVERSYVVYPLYHQHIDVGSVQPNAQLALVAASSQPFVPLNRYQFNFGRGADTSTGSLR